jgi:hypothetical protein
MSTAADTRTKLTDSPSMMTPTRNGLPDAATPRCADAWTTPGRRARVTPAARSGGFAHTLEGQEE